MDYGQLIYDGEFEILEEKLRNGTFRVNQKIDDISPLSFACLHYQPKIMKLLIENGADESVFLNETKILLQESCAEREFTQVRNLLKLGVNPNVSNGIENPLLTCVRIQHVELVRLLLEYGANPNLANCLEEARLIQNVDILRLLLLNGAYPQTCLSQACESGQFEIVELLLQFQANPNISGNERLTPLEFACRSGNVAIVELLLDYGADPRLGLPLSFGLIQGSFEITQLLLSRGANVNDRNSEGQTPLELAVSSKNIPCIRILLESGAEFTSKSIIEAILTRSPQICRLILDRRPELNFYSNRGSSLSLTISIGSFQMVQMLLEFGADPNLASPEENETPLILAVKLSNGDIVDLLLQFGAHINVFDRAENRALDYAVMLKNVPMILMLLNAGAYPDADVNDSEIQMILFEYGSFGKLGFRRQVKNEIIQIVRKQLEIDDDTTFETWSKGTSLKLGFGYPKELLIVCLRENLLTGSLTMYLDTSSESDMKWYEKIETIWKSLRPHYFMSGGLRQLSHDLVSNANLSDFHLRRLPKYLYESVSRFRMDE